LVSLTTSQQAALHRDKNIAVTAGAGTGKTLILVERYIDILLEEDVDIRELLAITFTNKAAAEMITRVESRLKYFLDEAKSEQRLKKLLYLRNHLSSSYISTIHSFCARILREYPMEAGGLDPGFTQLNDVQSEFLKEESIDEEISQIDQADGDWLDLFRLFGPNRIKTILKTCLDHRFEMIQIVARFEENSPTDLQKELLIEFIELMNNQFNLPQLSHIRYLVGQINDIDVSVEGSSQKKINIVSQFKNFIKTKSPQDPEYWNALFLLANIFTTKNGVAYKNLAHLGGKHVWASRAHDPLLELSNALVPISNWQTNFVAVPPGNIDLYVLENLKKLYALFLLIEKRYSEKKRKMIVVDYDDLQLLVLKMLRENVDVRQKISSRYKYIMVDEFQDTNQLQSEIILLLTDNKSDKLFIVGDPKQSIYGFRNADVRVFNNIKDKFKLENSESDLLLSESFRFKNCLNQFVNQIFSKILVSSATNQWEVGYDAVNTKRQDCEGGSVELALLSKKEDGNIQAEFIANRLSDFFSETEYIPGEVAIILRARTHLSEIEKQLRDHDIPFHTFGGRGFFQGQEIYDAFHLLKFLVNPNDNFALVGLLRSPFASVSDEGLFFLALSAVEGSYWQKIKQINSIKNIPHDDLEKIDLFTELAARWLSRRDRIGYFELLSEIYNESMYRAIVATDIRGDQILANLDKILNMTMDFEKGRFSSMVDLGDSLNKLLNTQVKEGDAPLRLDDDDTVKILTIHQAKGLEFPVVFMPYLEQKLGSNPKHTVIFDETFGAISMVPEYILQTFDTYQDSFYLYDLIKMKQKRKEVAELKRLFYVGCTRARDQLILTAESKNEGIPSDTSLQWLMDSLEVNLAATEEEIVKIGPDCKVLVHRQFEERKTDQDKKQKIIITSLGELDQIKPEIIAEADLPAFMRTTNDQPKGEIFSATQLMSYLDDPSEYARRYHLGFFEDDYEKLGMRSDEGSDGLKRGVLMHRILERYPDYDLDQLLGEIDDVDETNLVVLKKEAGQLMHQFMRSVEIKPALNAMQFKTEIGILMQIEEDFVTGTIDRLYKNEEGQWVVVDYKTNHIKAEMIEKVANQYMVQIEIYALLLAMTHPGQNRYLVDLYFVYPDRIYTNEFLPSQINQLKDKYKKTIREIKQYYPYTNQPIT
jgi:ATP-dependent helicase/nuclease subunit A